MKLWGGRFEKETNAMVDAFNACIGFGSRLYEQDILGSIAHATMLGEENIIPPEDAKKIVEGLKGILADAREGKIQWSTEAEDIHMNVETILIQRIGEAGKRLHTGRSRNDQCVLDTRMYARQSCVETRALLDELIETLLTIAQDHLNTIMPGYTHLQKAQPVTLAHYMMAYVQMFLRDRKRFQYAYDAANVMPLGSGALAATTYPLNRRAGGGAAGLPRHHPEQSGRRQRPGLPAGLSVRRFPVHDASEPLLRRTDPVEFLRVPFCGDGRRVLHRFLHHAPEEKPRRGGAAAGQDRPGLRRSVVPADRDEGHSAGL